MRHLRPATSVAVVGALGIFLYGCQQTDQSLPFELNEGEAATVTIDTNGGVLSIPPTFSIQFPPGSVPSSATVDAAVRLDIFPDDAGLVVPGTAFDIEPAGLQLTEPARVQISVPETLLQAGDALTLALGVLREDGSIATSVTTYDLGTGILTADIDELGPVAAVVALDAIPIELGTPPPLGGGTFPPVPTPPEFPGGPALQGPGVLDFSADCRPEGRQCFSSGLVRLWGDQIVHERLGEQLVLLNSTVTAELEYLTFDQFGSPTSAIGQVVITGDLRARLASVIATRQVGDELTFWTGAGDVPSATPVTVSGSTMIFAATSVESPFDLQFEITEIGTTDMLTIGFDGELEFKNDEGPSDFGLFSAQVRLRR